MNIGPETTIVPIKILQFSKVFLLCDSLNLQCYVIARYFELIQYRLIVRVQYLTDVTS